jgi:hypothetical protein
VAKDFLDIASRGTIDMALSSLARGGKIRRIRRGLYDVPRSNPALGGLLSPEIDQIARALARRYRWTVVPQGAWAANLLGLSTQVPAKIVYLSNGPNKRIQLEKRTLAFRHARPHLLGEPAGLPALVAQALRYIGKEHVDERALLHLQGLMSSAEKRKLIKATRFGVEWIYEAAKKIGVRPD